MNLGEGDAVNLTPKQGVLQFEYPKNQCCLADSTAYPTPCASRLVSTLIGAFNAHIDL